MLKTYVKNCYGHILFFCLLVVLAEIHFYQIDLLTYSGDEPRFVYYAYSIFKGALLKYPLTQFVQETGSMAPAHSIYSIPITLNIFNKTMFMMNSIVPPLLYSPALFFGKAYHAWELLRTAAFLYYCAGLTFIWLSLKTIFSTTESLLALALTSLSLPQLAQMSLANTEQAAMFFLAVALYFLIFRPISMVSLCIGAVAMCLIVFSSMRSMPLAGSVAAGFIARLWMAPTNIDFDKRKGLFIFLAISIIGACGWIMMQLSFTGTIAGSSLLNESPVGKTPIWFLHRLFSPLLGHKDGIFLLFPLVFISFLGLINAARKDNLVVWVSLAAWLAYYFLISLTSQSEGYAARLQFVLVEFFAIGLAFYIRDFRNEASIAILMLCATVSLFVVLMHLSIPYALMTNREFGLFQQILLETTQFLDLGQYLIWDRYSAWTRPDIPLFLPEAWNIGYQVFSFLVVVGFLLLISISNRCNAKIRNLSAEIAILITLFGFASLLVVPVPEQAFSITKSFINGQGSMKLVFKRSIGGKATITFGPEPFWQAPEAPSFYSVIVETKNGKIQRYEKRSTPEVRLSILGNIKSITISGDQSKRNWSNTVPVKVYISPFRRFIHY